MEPAVSTHAARMALNRDPELREWAENWLKEKERIALPDLDENDFERHWRYVRPERMHEGAVEAVSAYRQLNPEH
jgi:5-formyltetrahydrofolate cyclo-ligase